jgi:hypothetical protein
MSPKTLALTLSMLLTACAARGTDTPQPAPATPQTPQSSQPSQQQSAVCRMLAAEDVREVQGEAPQETQGADRVAGGLAISQCFFRLPTFSKSINVELVRPAPGSSVAMVNEFWRERFHPSALEERARESEENEERERESKRSKRDARGEKKERGEKEREGESKPLRVAGVGEEAFWSGNQITAALSVLYKDSIVRVSVGGPDPQDEKIKKATALARKLVGRL